MEPRKKNVGLLFLMILVAFAAINIAVRAGKGTEGGVVEAKARKVAPPWTAKDLKGKPLSLSDYKGKVVFFDFWATWCPPCVESIPDLISLQKTYGTNGFKIVAMSVDDDVSTVEKFIAKNKLKLNYDIVMAEREIIEAYEVEGFPTSFIIDREGKIAAAFKGAEEKATYVKVIEPLLAEKTEAKAPAPGTAPAAK